MSRALKSFFKLFKVNPQNTTVHAHPYKAGTINQPLFKPSMLNNLKRDIPGAIAFSAIFAAYFTFWPYGIKKFHYFINGLPTDTPQVTLEGGKAIVNIPTEHVKLDKPEE